MTMERCGIIERFAAVRRLAREAMGARRDAMAARNHDEEISSRRREVAACDGLVDQLAALEEAGALGMLAGLIAIDEWPGGEAPAGTVPQ